MHRRRFGSLGVGCGLLMLVAGCAGPRRWADPHPLPRNVRDKASEMVVLALNFLDVDYVWGGTTAAEGFDCSGFTRFVYREGGGIELPRTSEAQARAPQLAAVRRDALVPGDLIFFDTLGRAHSHVGIHVGEDKFVHAPRTGARVRIETLRSSYWSSRFTAARRAEALLTAVGG
jgi:cell wall-associated NlpC family hydrolase